MKMPYMKFYPQDWLGEQGLRLSSPASRGVWIDMMCLMQTGNHHGYMERGGVPYDEPHISMLIGVDKDTLKGCLQELKQNGVFSVDERGCIFSRRMVRDMEKYDKAVENGKLGGSPILKKRIQKLEARSQKLEATVA